MVIPRAALLLAAAPAARGGVVSPAVDGGPHGPGDVITVSGAVGGPGGDRLVTIQAEGPGDVIAHREMAEAGAGGRFSASLAAGEPAYRRGDGACQVRADHAGGRAVEVFAYFAAPPAPGAELQAAPAAPPPAPEDAGGRGGAGPGPLDWLPPEGTGGCRRWPCWPWRSRRPRWQSGRGAGGPARRGGPPRGRRRGPGPCQGRPRGPGAARMAAGGAASRAAITVLETLYANGPLTYRELKAQPGLAPKAEGGKLAYFLRKLLRHCLVSLDRQARRHSITGAGRACLGGLGRGVPMARHGAGPRAVPAEGLGSAEAGILHMLDTAGPQGHPGLRRLAGFEGGGGPRCLRTTCAGCSARASRRWTCRRGRTL